MLSGLLFLCQEIKHKTVVVETRSLFIALAALELIM